jgi:hypothetical protein
MAEMSILQTISLGSMFATQASTRALTNHHQTQSFVDTKMTELVNCGQLLLTLNGETFPERLNLETAGLPMEEKNTPLLTFLGSFKVSVLSTLLLRLTPLQLP